MFKTRTVCRACGYATPTTPDYIKAARPVERLVPVFSLGVQALANDFCKEDEEHAGYAPLEVLLCPRCGLGQLSADVRPDIMYARYLYTTSQSETMRAHFETIWRDIQEEAGHVPQNVIEIGSNDGLLLKFLAEHGAKNVMGVDPSVNLTEVSRSVNGVPALTAMFGQSAASLIVDMRPIMPVDLILARHVLCHCQDWRDFFGGLEKLCGNDTLICLETPYVGNLLANTEFDTVYHEHLSYLSIKSVVAVLEGTGLFLKRVTRYPIHGGAVMMTVQRKAPGRHAESSVIDFIAHEHDFYRQWTEFSNRAHRLIGELKGQVKQWRAQGKRVAGLGASAKSTVWVNACGFTKRDLAFIADSTPGKWYTTSPGSDIPVVDEGAIMRELPDYVICFAWNWRREIETKFKMAREKGVKLVFPVPSIEVV